MQLSSLFSSSRSSTSSSNRSFGDSGGHTGGVTNLIAGAVVGATHQPLAPSSHEFSPKRNGYKYFVDRAKTDYELGAAMKLVDCVKVYVAVRKKEKVEKVLTQPFVREGSEQRKMTQDEKDRVLNGKPRESSIAGRMSQKVATLTELEKLAAPCYPLHIAAFNGDLDMMKLLMDHGAQLATKDEGGDTAFHLLVQSHLDTVSIARAADVLQLDSNGRQPLAALCRPHFQAAVTTQDSATVLELLRLGVDPNLRLGSGGDTPVHIAIENEDLVTAEALLRRGADLSVFANENSWTPLHRASYNRSEEAVALLLKYGADPNLKPQGAGVSILHLAVCRGTSDVVRALLKGGADPNSADASGAAPLHLAVTEDHANVVKALLEASTTDVMRPDNNGGTPLHYCRNPEVIALFPPRCVVSEDDHGRTPLHYAAESGDAGTIDALVNLGGDVFAASKDGDRPTPLHCAAAKNNLPAAEALIAQGAETKFRIGSGKTPMQVATSPQMKKLLSLGREAAGISNLNSSSKSIGSSGKEELKIVALLEEKNSQLSKQLEEQQKQNENLSQQMAEQLRQMSEQRKQNELMSHQMEEQRKQNELLLRQIAGLTNAVAVMGAKMAAPDGFDLPPQETSSAPPSIHHDPGSSVSVATDPVTPSSVGGGAGAERRSSWEVDGYSVATVPASEAAAALSDAPKGSDHQRERKVSNVMEQEM